MCRVRTLLDLRLVGLRLVGLRQAPRLRSAALYLECYLLVLLLVGRQRVDVLLSEKGAHHLLAALQHVGNPLLENWEHHLLADPQRGAEKNLDRHLLRHQGGGLHDEGLH